MPAGSSERESRKPRRDKVSEMTQKMSFVVYIMGICRHLHLHFFCVSASDYGLFLSDDDPRKGIWLESGRTLDYYMLRNGVRLSHIVWGGEPSV